VWTNLIRAVVFALSAAMMTLWFGDVFAVAVITARNFGV